MFKLILFTLFITKGFGETYLGPGYVDLNPKSPIFSGVKNLATPSKILSEIFKGGIFQEIYFDIQIQEYQESLKAVEMSLCQKFPDKCEKENIHNELNKNTEYLAILKILELLNEAKSLGKKLGAKDLNTPNAHDFLNKLFTAIRMMEALKGPKFGNLKLSPPRLGNFIISRFKPLKTMVGKTESVDLMAPSQLFYSPKDLDSLKKQGMDISILDPPDGILWKRPKWHIKDYDLALNSLKDLIPMDEDKKLALLNPSETIDVTLSEEEPLMGYLPELVISFGGEKWNLRFPVQIQDINIGNDLKDAFNLFFESNLINANPLAINMARALGFNVEPVIFKQRIRIFFDKNGNFIEKKGNLLDRFSRKFPSKNYALPFFNHKIDESSGENYFELRGVTLQRINPIKIGVSSIATAEKILKREYRGLALFLAWIDDIGLDNIDVTLDGMEKISDLSLSFGRGFPNYFSSELIKKNNLLFRPINSKNLLTVMTPSDAKWILRKIAQFTPEQLYSGFINVGFPDLVAKIYVKKLMSRRNQLMDLLYLSKEGFAKSEEWTGTIEGFENYFSKKGNLQDFKFTINDPKLENFPTNWSSTWMPSKGDINRRSLKKLSLVTLNYGLEMAIRAGQLSVGFSNKEFKWRELRYVRHRYGPLCSGNCFYQGVELGGTSFVPQRILIKNPDTESFKKFLVIEIFRIAIEAHLGQNIEQLLGLSPLPIKIGGGVSGFYVYEFIRIKPVENVMPLLQDVKNLFKLPVFSFNKFRDEWLDSADEGDTMILSSYLGLQGDVLAGPPSLLNFFSLFAGLTGRMALTNRLVLRKMENKIFQANWGSLKESELSLFFGYGISTIIDDAWIQARVNWSKRKENIYQFDLSQEKERQYLEKNLTAIAPRKIPDQLKLKLREKKKIGTSFYIGLKENLSFSITSDYGERNVFDYLENKGFRQIYFERVKIKKFKGEYYETYISFMDENFKTRLKITYTLESPKFNRDQLANRLTEIQSILGFKIFPYKIDKINYDLGSVSFLGMVYFSPEAVTKILSISENEICESYLKSQDDMENLWRCKDKKYTVPLSAFLKDFEQIKSSKDNLDFQKNKKQIYWFLKNFTDLLSRYGEKRGTAEILKSFLKKNEYFEIAFMLSDRDPFPGNTSEILLASPSTDGLYPSITEIADSNTDSFALYSDKITEAIKPYFFYNYKPKGINRTEEIMQEIFSKLKFSYR